MLQTIKALLKEREFISVATCDLESRPNAAPKFFLKIDGNELYLIDYTWGRTYDNILVNPRVSLSLMDTDFLRGYQLNGSARIIDSGATYEAICAELLQRAIDLSTRRIIEGVTREKTHGNFEVALPDKFVVFKIRIEEIVEIGPTGHLKREKL